MEKDGAQSEMSDRVADTVYTEAQEPPFTRDPQPTPAVAQVVRVLMKPDVAGSLSNGGNAYTAQGFTLSNKTAGIICFGFALDEEEDANNFDFGVATARFPTGSTATQVAAAVIAACETIMAGGNANPVGNYLTAVQDGEYVTFTDVTPGAISDDYYWNFMIGSGLDQGGNNWTGTAERLAVGVDESLP